MVPGPWWARRVPAWRGGQWNDARGTVWTGVHGGGMEEMWRRGDLKGNVPHGMMRVWTPEKAVLFSSPDTCSSMAFNHNWLVDPRRDPGGKLDAAQRGGAITAHEQPEVAVLGVAAIREVLALHDLLHDGIRIDPRVIHPGRVALHRVLLPPERAVGQMQGPGWPWWLLRGPVLPLTALRALHSHAKAPRGAAAGGRVAAVRQV